MRYFLILLCFLTPTAVFSQKYDCLDHHCIAVVDAGSTGSRLHIYTYDTDTTNSPINIKEIWNKKVKPGFATIDSSQVAIDSYLTLLMNDAPVKQMPVYFYATAGMRLLPSNAQHKYFVKLKKWFSNQSQWQLKDAKTITGNEEGLYDWLSVNYHLGTFTNTNQQSIGVMDMGGASVQIAFPVTNPANNNLYTKVSVYGQEYTLYVHSFLGLGQTAMSQQFLNSSNCFNDDYPLPDGGNGQGNSQACEQEVASLISLHGVKQLIQPLLAANQVDAWYSVGGISNLADNPLFQFNNSQFTNSALLQQADAQICHQPWERFNDQFPNDDYLYGYCLFASYYYALMVDGYGFYPEQTIHYLPPQQNIDWTTGVVLHHND